MVLLSKKHLRALFQANTYLPETLFRIFTEFLILIHHPHFCLRPPTKSRHQFEIRSLKRSVITSMHTYEARVEPASAE